MHFDIDWRHANSTQREGESNMYFVIFRVKDIERKKQKFRLIKGVAKEIIQQYPKSIKCL